MKQIFQIILLLTLITAMNGCYKDKGNYSYAPNEVILIKGIDKTYNKLSRIDRIQLDPEVSSSSPGAEFEYLWRMYEYKTEGIAPKMITIGREKKLDYLVENDAREWMLVFTVTNKKTGYAESFESNVNVGTIYTRGWYVLKSANNQTDIDMFQTPVDIRPAGKLENIFSAVNGRKLQGTGTMLQYYNNYKVMNNGKAENMNSLFALTEKDGTVANLNFMRENKSFGNFFRDVPATIAPGFICEGGYGRYVVNNGGVYGIFAFTQNYGIFGARVMADQKNRPYQLSRYYLTNMTSLPVFFDETSSTFATASLFTPYMDEYTNADDTQMPAAKNNQQLLFMGQSLQSPLQGYAVLQDKTDAGKKVIASVIPSGMKLGLYTKPILPSEKMFNARLYTLINNSENMIYFVNGNEVWSRGLSSGAEQLQFNAPAGETITFIRHRWYSAIYASDLDAAYKFNYVMIGTTNTVGKYKVYMFRKQSGNLVETPDFVLEGEGEPRDVIYISPRMRPSQEIMNSY